MCSNGNRSWSVLALLSCYGLIVVEVVIVLGLGALFLLFFVLFPQTAMSHSCETWRAATLMTHCSVFKCKPHYAAVYDDCLCAHIVPLISLFQQKTPGWDRDHSKTLFTSTIAKATCLSYTMQEAGSKWRGNTLPLSRLIQYWQSPQSKLDAPFL